MLSNQTFELQNHLMIQIFAKISTNKLSTLICNFKLYLRQHVSILKKALFRWLYISNSFKKVHVTLCWTPGPPRTGMSNSSNYLTGRKCDKNWQKGRTSAQKVLSGPNFTKYDWWLKWLKWLKLSHINVL